MQGTQGRRDVSILPKGAFSAMGGCGRRESGLTDTLMRVDAREQARTDAVLVVLLVWDVSACLRVSVLLREAKVDHVQYRFGRFARRHDKVRRLDVPVNESSRMDVLYACKLRVERQSWSATREEGAQMEMGGEVAICHTKIAC